MLRDAGYNTFAVGKWHLAPRWEQTRVGSVRPLAARPRLRALLRLPRRRHQPVDARARARQRLRRRRRARPRTATTSPRTSPTAPSASSSTSSRRRRASRSSSTSRPGAMHAPHQAPRRVDRRATAAASTTAGRRGAARAFARQLRARRRARAARRCRRVRRGSRTGRRSPADERRLYARMMEVFAGFLAHTDAQIGRVLGCPRRARRARRHARAADLRQRRERRGRPARARSTSTASRTTWSTTSPTRSRASTSSAASAPTTTTPGAGRGPGNTPLPPVEALHVARRRAHAADRALAAAASPARGEVRRAVLPRHRPHADDPRRRRHRARPTTVDGVPQQPIDGASLAARPSPTRTRPRRARTQYFEMLGSRVDLPRRLEGDDRPRRQRSSSSSASASPGSHDFDDDHWALFDLDDDFAEARDVAAEHPDGVRRLVELWWAEAGRNQVLPLEDGFIGARQSRSSRRRGGFRGARRAACRAADRSRRRCCRRWAAASACRPTSRCGERGAHGVVVRARRLEQRLGAATCSTAGRSRASTCFGEPFRVGGDAAAGAGTARRRGPVPPRVGRRRAARAPRRRRAGRRETRMPGELPFRWQIGGTGAARRAATAAFPCATTTDRRRHSAAPSSAWSSSRFSCYRRTCKRRSRRCSSESERAGSWISSSWTSECPAWTGSPRSACCASAFRRFRW